MGLFSRKPKKSTAQAVKDYFDEQLLHPHLIAGMDPLAMYLSASYDSIVKADPTFAAVPLERFAEEVLPVRVEIFQTAWSHHFKTKTPYIVAEGHATTAYLAAEGRADLLERGLPYSHAVAASSAMLNVSPETMGGKLQRGNNAFVNTFRANLFKTWRDAGLSGDEAARAANRVATDVNFDKQGPARLAWALLETLEVQVNNDALFACAAILFGFYSGARSYLQQFDISA